MMLPEIARTMNGVAIMNPLAMSTMMKKGMSAPMLDAPSGSPNSPMRAEETPVMVAKTPAIDDWVERERDERG